MPAGPTAARRIRLGVATLAGAALLYEVALTRLSSVLVYTHLTAVVIAVCLAALGLGAGHAHRRAAAGRLDAAFLARSAAWASACGALVLAPLTRSVAAFALGLFALPFFWTGACAAAAYVVIGRRPGITYAFELAGGALGALLAPLLLPRLGDVDTALLAATLAAVCVGLLSPLSRIAPWRILPAPALLALNLAVPGGIVVVDPYAEFGFRSHLVEQTRARRGRVVATAYDSYARTDLVETDEPFMRYLFTDRMYAARVARWDGRSPRFGDPELTLLSRLRGFPFRALKPRRCLVLGAGGGFGVALALQNGARSVDAVEVNAAMIRFTRSLSGFCGSIYDRSEVRVFEAEARCFLRGDRQRYDLVDLSLMQTDPASLRSSAGVQNWVFTLEAVLEYLDHLTAEGAVAVVQNSRELAERTVWTVLSALERGGLSREGASARLLVLALPRPAESPFNHLVLVGRGELAQGRLAARAVEEGLEVIDPAAAGLRPGDRPGGPPPGFDPPTDDRPAFYEPKPALVSLFRSLLLLSIALFLGALLRDRLVSTPDGGAGLSVQGWLAAGSLGAAFMLAQAALIDRAQFLLGRPVAAVGLVVGATLLFSACGAAAGRGLAPDAPGRRLAGAAGVTGMLLVAASFLSAQLPRLLHGTGFATQAAAMTAVLAAVAIPAGLCLPACIERFSGLAPQTAAAVYTADGLAAVVGAAGASLLATQLGISRVFVAAAAAYGLAAAAGGFSPGPRAPRASGLTFPPSAA